MTQEPESDSVLRVSQAYALRKTDPLRAFEEFSALADEGCPDGMLQLAWCYERGVGTAPNLELTELWYRRAYETGAERVKMHALIYLGRFYLLQKDFAKAHEIFSAGATINYPPAIYQLGRLYSHGLGVERDPSKALLLFERASKEGNLLARWSMAILLMSGRFGVSNIGRGMCLLFRTVRDILSSIIRADFIRHMI